MNYGYYKNSVDELGGDGCGWKAGLVAIGFVAIILAISLSLSPKSIARVSTDMNVVDLGSIPVDVCIENGVPQISTFSIDEDDVHIGYVDRHGKIVLAVYVKDAVNASWQQLRLKYTMTGGSCHDDRDKDQ